MRSARLVELARKIEQPVEGLGGVSVFITHVGRASSGLPRVRASLWNGELVANGVLEPDVETDRWCFARAAVAQAPGIVPDPMPIVAALKRCAEALHQQDVLELASAQATEQDVENFPARPSHATRLVALVEESGVVLFHTPDGEPYATVPADPMAPARDVGGATTDDSGETHLETWPLRAKGFRHWLARRYYVVTRSAVGGQAVQDALTVLQGRALYEGEEHGVHTRLGEHDGAIYLDLADAAWRVVRIASDEPDGWWVLAAADAPVRFRRPRGLLPLPEPVRGGSLDELRPFVNAPEASGEDQWRLLVAWLVAALRPRGPYPALAISGEQGAAKSTAARVLRALVDPNAAALRAQPRDPRDLMIAATNGWIVAFDNLSAIPAWLSDALCRLSTGGGFSVRELYSDAEESLFDAQRPVLFTGIEELATRGDLLDRSLVVTLPPIPEERRQTEAAFWPAFEEARPGILGALLSAVATAQARLPSVQLARLPRMADFALWVSAAEPALWSEPGGFVRAYEGNRTDAREVALEAAPLVPALRQVVAAAPGRCWEGTATELLKLLNEGADERTQKADGWPKNGQALGGALRRLAPDLRATGLDVEVGKRGPKRGGRRRLVALRGPSAEAPNAPDVKDPLDAHDRRGERPEPTGAPQPPALPSTLVLAATGDLPSAGGGQEQVDATIVPSVPRVHLAVTPGEPAPLPVDGVGVGRPISARVDGIGGEIVPPAPGEVDGVDAGDDVSSHRTDLRARPTSGGTAAQAADQEEF